MTDREAIDLLAARLQALVDVNPYGEPRMYDTVRFQAESALRTVRARTPKPSTKPKHRKP